ncbi:MAG: T9SS type A sorting domain-containing protein, partial [Bacteroidia bacterium]|nr:T9SS type A sorting domain-containing protein [Bacteroidia bacterium]MDW8334318.1 T9SS type A sorting domain-containing protein [Bacteroidia bacterium]
YWKLSEALCQCVYENLNCVYAFGNTPEQRSMGQWSDGTPVNELVIDEPVSRSGLSAPISNFVAYPVPFQDRVIVEFSHGAAEIELADASGRALYRRRSASPVEISTSSLPPGVYVLRIGSETTKIVKTP